MDHSDKTNIQRSVGQLGTQVDKILYNGMVYQASSTYCSVGESKSK